MRVERKGGGGAWLMGTLTAVCRDIDCLDAGIMTLSESFFEPLVAGNQKASFTSLFP